jgi:hypothetical protein
MGWACFGCVSWSSTQPKTCHSLCSRVVEKTSQAAVSAYMHIIASIPDLASYNHIEMWSDSAGQFRSRLAMASIVFQLWDVASRDSLKAASFHFFAPKHGKGAVDGLFGQQQRILTSAYQVRDHTTITDIVNTLKTHYDEIAVACPSEAKHVVCEWLPLPKHSYKWRKFEVASVGPMMASFAFKVTYKDSRRILLRGVGTKFNTVTNCDFYNLVLAGHTPAGSNRGEPRLRELDEVEPADDCPEELDPVSLDFTQQSVAGWRTSFVKDTSRKETLRINHLTKVMKGMPTLVHTEPSRHIPSEETRAAQAATAMVHNRNTKEKMKHYNDMKKLLSE